MIRPGTLIKGIVLLGMMIAINFILPELNRRRIVTPWTGQIIFLAAWVGYFIVRKMLNNRRSRATAVESPEQIRNRIDILTQQLLAGPAESWKLLYERGTLKFCDV